MSEHHGLDLDALYKANGGHSVFGASGSAMFLTCSGSLIPNLTAPDDAGEDAAYGTVGHEVGEQWLLRIADERKHLDDPITEELIDRTQPDYMLGMVKTIQQREQSFDITIDEEMIAYVRQYIERCAEAPGKHHIETRVDYSKLTPLEKQGGTADFAACAERVLRIKDLKMGKGVEVYAADDLDDPRSLKQLSDGTWTFQGNPQTMLYACGFVYKWDWLYDFEDIEIEIVQPRRNHFQTWRTTKAELMRFAEWAKDRMHAAWVIDAPRTPSDKGCKWCKVKRTCKAVMMFRESKVDDVFEPVVNDDGSIQGEFHVVTAPQMAAYEPKKPTVPPAGEMSTAQMAYLLPYRALFEKMFAEIESELYHRAVDGELIPGYKLVDGRLGDRRWLDSKKAREALLFIGLEVEDVDDNSLLSPAQIEEKLKARFKLTPKKAKLLIDDLISRKEGKQVLAPERDKREALDDVGAVFDDVSDGI